MDQLRWWFRRIEIKRRENGDSMLSESWVLAPFSHGASIEL
jgi:hypothetical protein